MAYTRYLSTANSNPPLSTTAKNFFPALSFPGSGLLNNFGRWLYRFTQLRVHVMVTHGFLKSLGNLRLQRSRVGRLRLTEPLPLVEAAADDREAVAG